MRLKCQEIQELKREKYPKMQMREALHPKNQQIYKNNLIPGRQSHSKRI